MSFDPPFDMDDLLAARAERRLCRHMDMLDHPPADECRIEEDERPTKEVPVTMSRGQKDRARGALQVWLTLLERFDTDLDDLRLPDNPQVDKLSHRGEDLYDQICEVLESLKG